MAFGIDRAGRERDVQGRARLGTRRVINRRGIDRRSIPRSVDSMIRDEPTMSLKCIEPSSVQGPIRENDG